MNLPPARKRFGQHFLVDDDVIQRIVAAIAPACGETIVEIGPGRGAITRPLVQLASRYYGIEFDRDLVPLLQRDFGSRDNVQFCEADALTFDFAGLGSNLRVVGNLPYNISTPLLFRMAELGNNVIDMHFMLQKEVVERIVAGPGSRTYGRLTIMLGAFLEAVPLFDVPPEAFRPPPKVTSSVIRLRPQQKQQPTIAHAGQFEAIVKLAFSRRRKTLRNALKGMVDATMLESAGLNPDVRPEQVDIADWIALANSISDNAGGAA